jgi:hypothetical protein
MFGGSKGVGVTIKSYGKLEISYINVDNTYIYNSTKFHEILSSSS